MVFNGKNVFYQWDLDQKLTVTDPEVNEVHFCNQTGDCALVCEVYAEGEDRLVNVPNILLQEAWPIRAYAYCDCATKAVQKFEVIARSKPDDYVYTETEIKNWADLDKRLRVLEEGGIPEPGGGGQVNLAFDGEYNAETNKVATVQTVTTKVAEIVANAPEDFDTLKELADWLSTHGGEAAKMNSDIKANADAIAEEVARAKEEESEIRSEIVNADYNENDTSKKSHILNRPFYKNSDRSRYTCDSYKHQAKVDGVINDRFGFATTEIVSLSELGACEIEVECDNQSPDEPSKETRTLSLGNASVRMVAGGYILEVAGFNNCPNARVYVITDASTFNRVCTCDLESNGTYLVITTTDGDHWSYFSTVKAIIKSSVKKLDNMFLDLENNKYFHSVVGDISSALDAIIAKQTEVIGGES